MEKNENGYSRESNCSCRRSCTASEREGGDDSLQLGMVYSPYQSFRMLMTPESGLMAGTIFEELYKPLLEKCDE